MTMCLSAARFSREFTPQVPSAFLSHGHATHLHPRGTPFLLRIVFPQSFILRSFGVQEFFLGGALWYSQFFGLSLGALRRSCHPSVTPDALEKGCKRPVHRRSVTLSPYDKKKPSASYCAQLFSLF